MKKLQILSVLFIVFLFAACKKDNNTGNGDNQLPNAQTDWTTYKTSTLNVTVDDQHDARFYYTVEAYMGNPAIDPNAKLISGSGQKTNSNVSYSRQLVLPDAMETLFIKVTDPFKRIRVYAVAVQEGNMTYVVGQSASTKSATSDIVIPEIDYTYNAANCEILSGSDAVTFVRDKSYLIEAGTTFSGDFTLPGEGRVNIYVAGTWVWEKSTMLNNSIKIYVLDGGLVKNQAGTCNISLNVASLIAIQQGGIFSDENSSFTFDITNQNTILNEGSFNATSIHMSNRAELYNLNVMNLELLDAQNMTNPIVNQHTMHIDELVLNNAIVYNECMMYIDHLSAIANGVINISPTGYINAVEMDAAGLTVNLDQNAMWEGNRATFGGQYSYIKGGDVGYALFKVKNIEATEWLSLNYSGMVEIECETHTQLANQWDKLYTISGAAAFADGQASVTIEPSDCNGNGGNTNPGEGEGDGEGEYEEIETLPYTYMFEDLWPYKGDYDMNDLVISIEIRNTVEQEKTKAIRVVATLYAVGATRNIGAAFQLDGIPASAVNGSLSGLEYAVVPLFSDAHTELGVPRGQITNTYHIDCPEKEIVKEITFNDPIDKVINVNNFNLFIILDGNFGDSSWDEVHLPGFLGTSKANVHSNSTEDYFDIETGWMWAICIPQADFATYPKETIPIYDAYEGFREWAAGSGTPGWYFNPISSKVLVYENNN